MNALHVLTDDASVGVLSDVSDRSSPSSPSNHRIGFAYAATWLSSPTRFAISHSMPLRAEPFGVEAERFFGNLLPEGAIRTAVCRRLGISEDNDFALLRAIGHECAGALRIVEKEREPATPQPDRRLRDADLERWAGSGAYAGAVGVALRLSLAGAQDKLGVRVDGDKLLLPGQGSPSTHLLKFPHRDFAALPQNEALVLSLARRVGLPTADARLWTRHGAPLLLVARFDRSVGPPTRRRHQEDFAQALGLDRRRKYEAEGGPTFHRCLELVREVSATPLPDSRSLLRWLAFCAVVGNRDNHAKNLSLLRDDSGHWRLAPFYDLVCTTAYGRLSARLAMTIGGRADAGNLPAVAWHDEARTLGVKARYLVAVVEEVTDAIAEALAPAIGELAELLGRDDELVPVRRAIDKGIRATRRGLRARGP